MTSSSIRRHSASYSRLWLRTLGATGIALSLLGLAGCGSSTTDSSATLAPSAAPPAQRASLVAAPTPRPVLDARSQVKARYGAWKQRWASMDLNGLMSFYSPRVVMGTSTGYRGLRRRRQQQFASERSLRINDLTKPQITIKGNEAALAVRQEFDSTTAYSKGIKRLTWQKSGGRWLIVRERFTTEEARSKAGLQPTVIPVPQGEAYTSSNGRIDTSTSSGYDDSDDDSDSDYDAGSDYSPDDSYDSSDSYGSGDSDDSDSSSQEASSGSCSTGATAVCDDGSLSYSAHRQGTCSHHGGVAVWCN